MNDLDTICIKILKKAVVTQLVNAIQFEFKRNTQQLIFFRSVFNFITQRVPRLSSINDSHIRKFKLNKLIDAKRNLLATNKSCFLCKKINAEHIASNCPERKDESVSNVKKKEISIVNEYVVRHHVSFESDINSDSYSFISIITILTQIQ